MGRIHPHPQGRKVRRKASGHLPWGFHLQDWQGCLKFSKHHGSIAIFVIELKELNVVVVGSGGVRGGLCGINLLDDIIELCEFLAFFISLTKTNAHLLCGVHAKGIHDISEKEKVKLAFAIPIIDV